MKLSKSSEHRDAVQTIGQEDLGRHYLTFDS